MPNGGADSGHDFIGHADEAAVIKEEVVDLAGGVLAADVSLMQAVHFLEPAGAVDAGFGLGFGCDGFGGGMIGNGGVKHDLAGKHGQCADGLGM